VFSAEYRNFVELDKDRMVQFLPLGLQIPADHPDRKRYFSRQLRARPANSSDVAEITLVSPGDILFLYTDGVYDGSDTQERQHLEAVKRPSPAFDNLLINRDLTERSLRFYTEENLGRRFIRNQIYDVRPYLM
jgi:hypothetical protein